MVSTLKTLCFIFCLASGTVWAGEFDSRAWAKIDSINKTLGPKGKMPPAFRVFQEQLEIAIQILGDRELNKHYQEVKARALETDDFREATKLKKRAAPAFILEFDSDDDVKLLDFDYFYSRTLEGSDAREFLSIYKQYHLNEKVDVIQPGAQASKCFFPFDPSRSAKWSADSAEKKRANLSAAEIKTRLQNIRMKLPKGFLKTKAQDFESCMAKSEN